MSVRTRKRDLHAVNLLMHFLPRLYKSRILASSWVALGPDCYGFTMKMLACPLNKEFAVIIANASVDHCKFTQSDPLTSWYIIIMNLLAIHGPSILIIIGTLQDMISSHLPHMAYSSALYL